MDKLLQFWTISQKKLNLDQKYVFYSRTLTENRDKIVLQLSSRLFVWKQQKKLSTNCREQWLQFGCKIEYLHSFAYTNYRHNFRRVKYVNCKNMFWCNLTVDRQYFQSKFILYLHINAIDIIPLHIIYNWNVSPSARL